MDRDDWPVSTVPMRKDAMDPGVYAAIRRRARDIWEAEGRPQGREVEHWLRAEMEILGQAPPLA